jgi:hypothetical protein
MKRKLKPLVIMLAFLGLAFLASRKSQELLKEIEDDWA